LFFYLLPTYLLTISVIYSLYNYDLILLFTVEEDLVQSKRTF